MPTNNITGLLLAGGEGRRVGGQDKGLLTWRGKSLAEHVAGRLSPQVDTLLLVCNRNREHYRAITPHIVSDVRDGYQGPLAGIEAAMGAVTTELLLVVACDVPLLPPDLAQRLRDALAAHPGSGVAYAHDGERAQYLCALLRRDRLAALGDFLDQGHRAVKQWYAQQGAVAVDFSDQASAFCNINVLPDAFP